MNVQKFVATVKEKMKRATSFLSGYAKNVTKTMKEIK